MIIVYISFGMGQVKFSTAKANRFALSMGYACLCSLQRGIMILYLVRS